MEENDEEALCQEADALFEMGEYERCLALCKKGLATKGEEGGFFLNLAALCCVHLRDGQSALRYSSKQVDVAAAECGKKSRIFAIALLAKANALRLLGRMKEAHKVADEAISIWRELNDQDGLGVALGRKAAIFFEQEVSH